MGKRNYFEIDGLLDMPETVSYEEVVDKFVEWVESLGGFAATYWKDVTKEARETNGEVEDDFPFCSLSGCEAAKEGCHIGCPYGKENYNV